MLCALISLTPMFFFLYIHTSHSKILKARRRRKRFFLNKIIILIGENVLKIFDSMPTNKRKKKKLFLCIFLSMGNLMSFLYT